jgi:hypothetical protein
VDDYQTESVKSIDATGKNLTCQITKSPPELKKHFPWRSFSLGDEVAWSIQALGSRPKFPTKKKRGKESILAPLL